MVRHSFPARFRLSAPLLVLPLVACMSCYSSAHAQAPTPAAPGTLQSAPVPQPIDSVPSMPAPTTQYSAPQPTPAVTPAPYRDPLETPIPFPATGQPATTLAPGSMTPAATPPTAADVHITAPTSVSMPPQYLPAYSPEDDTDHPDHLGSTYIPVDSPVYAMALRLYGLGYLDTAFINMRPWTRRSLLHALDATKPAITEGGDEQAQQIYARLVDLVHDEVPAAGFTRGNLFGAESVYVRLMGVGGVPLRDSYHFGQTLINDYGRPYAKGFNSILGFSSVSEYGRFSLYVRGELQHAPAADAYSLQLTSLLSCTVDLICPFAAPNAPQATIQYGKYANSVDTFRLQEANLSFHIIGHEISFGKSDSWLGPGAGGAMAWTNNAENIYSFRVNRVEPLHIPLLSRLIGNMRYDFMVGSLKGHTDPNDPWVHSIMFAFNPTTNLQFGFQRTVIWGGKDHEPITLHTFLKSFFDINDTTGAEKFSRNDPGARFTAFNFSYRLPVLHRSLLLYADSEAHDDVTPPSAPRRSAYRPGLYLAHFPGMQKLDFRVEAASTDCSTLRCLGGQFNYREGIQTQGYTNKGFINADWIGREAKGGQAWLTYHLSADEFVQFSYLNKKTPKDFIPQGTTQNQFKLEASKNFGHNFTADAWVQSERWNVPIYKAGVQSDTTVAVQFTYFPHLRATVVPKPR